MLDMVEYRPWHKNKHNTHTARKSMVLSGPIGMPLNGRWWDLLKYEH